LRFEQDSHGARQRSQMKSPSLVATAQRQQRAVRCGGSRRTWHEWQARTSRWHHAGVLAPRFPARQTCSASSARRAPTTNAGSPTAVRQAERRPMQCFVSTRRRLQIHQGGNSPQHALKLGSDRPGEGAGPCRHDATSSSTAPMRSKARFGTGACSVS